MAKKSETKTKKEQKYKGGKKPKWEEMNMPAKLEAVTGWAKEGYIDAEIAKLLNISESLLYNWKNQYPEFKQALLKGKEIANGELVNAAFRNATGYYITVTEPMKLRDEFGAEHIKMVTYDKYIPANSTMGIFMLKNRLPEQYRDKQEQRIEGDLGIKIEVDYGDEQ